MPGPIENDDASRTIANALGLPPMIEGYKIAYGGYLIAWLCFGIWLDSGTWMAFCARSPIGRWELCPWFAAVFLSSAISLAIGITGIVALYLLDPLVFPLYPPPRGPRALVSYAGFLFVALCGAGFVPGMTAMGLYSMMPSIASPLMLYMIAIGALPFVAHETVLAIAHLWRWWCRRRRAPQHMHNN